MIRECWKRVPRGLIAAAAAVVIAPLVALASPSSATGAYQVTTFPDLGYGYLTPGPDGSMWSANYDYSQMALISASGSISYSTVDYAWADTSDSQGNGYTDNWDGGPIYEVTPQGVVTPLFSGWDELYGMAWGPDGNLYVSYDDGYVYRIAPDGSSTLFASGAGGEGLAFDHSGNLYSGGGDAIYEISPLGDVTTFAVVPGAYFYDVTVSPFSNQVYAVDDDNGVVYSFSAGGAPTPVLTSAELPGASTSLGSLAFDEFGNLYVNDWDTYNVYKVLGVAGSPPRNLVVTPGTESLTATWTAATTGASYQCTLMYGYNNPSSFTETVTGSSCTFSGLDPNTVFGIRVGLAGAGASDSATAYGQPIAPATTITCGRRHSTRTVTGVNPTCPPGWHIVH